MQNNFKNKKLVALDLDETMTETHANYTEANMRALGLQRALYNRIVERGDKMCIITNQHDTAEIHPVIGYLTGNRHNYRNIKIVDSRELAEAYQDYIRVVSGTIEDQEEFGDDMPQYTTSLVQDDKTEIFPDFTSDDPEKQRQIKEILIINPYSTRIASKSHYQAFSEYGKAGILNFLAGHLGIDNKNILLVEDNADTIDAAEEKGIGVYEVVKNSKDFEDIIKEILETELSLEEKDAFPEEQSVSFTSEEQNKSPSAVPKENNAESDNVTVLDPEVFEKKFYAEFPEYISNIEPYKSFTTTEVDIFQGAAAGDIGKYISNKGEKRSRSSGASVSANFSTADSASNSMERAGGSLSSLFTTPTGEENSSKRGRYIPSYEANVDLGYTGEQFSRKKKFCVEEEKEGGETGIRSDYSVFSSIAHDKNDEPRHQKEPRNVSSFKYMGDYPFASKEEINNAAPKINIGALRNDEHLSSMDYHYGAQEDNQESGQVFMGSIMKNENEGAVYDMSKKDEEKELITIPCKFERTNEGENQR